MKYSAIFLILFLFSSEAFAKNAKNIIILSMNGMGLPQRTLARMVASGPYGKLHMDRYPITGYMTAHSGDSWVTDGAASGTAIATGFKTDNGLVGVMADGERKMSLFDRATAMGKNVGIVTTGRVTSPFCASFYSHIPNKYLEHEAAEQMIKKKINLLYGGGRISFIPETEGGIRPDASDYIQIADRSGYLILNDRSQLAEIDPARTNVLGIFADSSLSFEIDRKTTQEPSLSEMTNSALKFLSTNKSGFCLLVESNRIADACANHDPVALVAEILEADRVAALCKTFAEKNEDTLVIVLSSYESGGMIISEFVDTVELDALKTSVWSISSKVDSLLQNLEDVLRLYGGIRLLKKEEKEYLMEYSKRKLFAAAIGDVISNRAGVFWMPLSIQEKTASFSAITSATVPISAYGTNSFMFSGYHDNTELGRLLFEAAGFSFKTEK